MLNTIYNDTTTYDYDGTTLMSETRNGHTYTYDESGTFVSIRDATPDSDTVWHVLTNMRGDIESIYDSNGSLHARYIYDTWGRSISITDASGNAITSSSDIANINPLRYRGYYYDTETEMYYLISRYYDTASLRFINADAVDYIDASGTVLGCNMYAYCENDAVNNVDSEGFTKIPVWVFKAVYNAGGPLLRQAKHLLAMTGMAFLKNRGLVLAERMYGYSFYGKSLFSVSNICKLIISRLIECKSLRKTLKLLVKHSNCSRVNKTFWPFIFKNNSNDLAEKDLFYSMQKVTLRVSGRRSGNHWNLKFI